MNLWEHLVAYLRQGEGPGDRDSGEGSVWEWWQLNERGEFRLQTHDAHVVDVLKNFGLDGWELVSVVAESRLSDGPRGGRARGGAGTSTQYVFKRLITPESFFADIRTVNHDDLTNRVGGG